MLYASSFRSVGVPELFESVNYTIDGEFKSLKGKLREDGGWAQTVSNQPRPIRSTVAECLPSACRGADVRSFEHKLLLAGSHEGPDVSATSTSSRTRRRRACSRD